MHALTYMRIRRRESFWARYHGFRVFGIGIIQSLHWAL
jgi:hypothetical protein